MTFAFDTVYGMSAFGLPVLEAPDRGKADQKKTRPGADNATEGSAAPLSRKTKLGVKT